MVLINGHSDAVIHHEKLRRDAHNLPLKQPFHMGGGPKNNGGDGGSDNSCRAETHSPPSSNCTGSPSQTPANETLTSSAISSGTDTDLPSSLSSLISSPQATTAAATVDGSSDSSTAAADAPDSVTGSGVTSTNSNELSSSTFGTPFAQVALAHHTNERAIAGGVIGSLAFLAFLIMAFLCFLRRRRRSRIPASAEFRVYAVRNGGLPLGTYENARQSSTENLDEPPPPFSQGQYNDPLFEKLHQTRQAHINYGLAI